MTTNTTEIKSFGLDEATMVMEFNASVWTDGKFHPKARECGFCSFKALY